MKNQKNIEPKAEPAELKPFFFSRQDRTIMATSLEEATAKMEAELKKEEQK